MGAAAGAIVPGRGTLIGALCPAICRAGRREDSGDLSAGCLLRSLGRQRSSWATSWPSTWRSTFELGDERLHLTPRVYATQEALDADAAPCCCWPNRRHWSQRSCPRYNPSLWPAPGGERTRLVVLTSSAIRVFRASRQQAVLCPAAGKSQAFTENLLFEAGWRWRATAWSRRTLARC